MECATGTEPTEVREDMRVWKRGERWFVVGGGISMAGYMTRKRINEEKTVEVQ